MCFFPHRQPKQEWILWNYTEITAFFPPCPPLPHSPALCASSIMPSQPQALRLLLKLSELVSSMNHRDVQHVQSQDQMNGFPLEVHRAIWGTWEDNATKTPPSFTPAEGKICTALPRSPGLLQCNVLFLSSETCIVSPFLLLCSTSVHCGLGQVVFEGDSVCTKRQRTGECKLPTDKRIPLIKAIRWKHLLLKRA